MKKVYTRLNGFGAAVKAGVVPFKGRYYYYKVRRLFPKWKALSDRNPFLITLPPKKKVRGRFWEDKQEYTFSVGGDEYTITAYDTGVVYMKRDGLNFIPEAVEINWCGGCRPVNF